MPDLPENMTPDECANYLRVSERTLIRWRNQRIGPPWTKCGGKVLYRRKNVDAWLDQNVVEAYGNSA